MTCGLARRVQLARRIEQVVYRSRDRSVDFPAFESMTGYEYREALTHQASKEDLPLRTPSRRRISGTVRQGKTTMRCASVRLATTIEQTQVLSANNTHLCPSLVTSLFSVDFSKVLFNAHNPHAVHGQHASPLSQRSVLSTHLDKHWGLALQHIPETQPHRIRRPRERGTEPFLRLRTACSEVGFPCSIQGLRRFGERKVEVRSV